VDFPSFAPAGPTHPGAQAQLRHRPAVSVRGLGRLPVLLACLLGALVAAPAGAMAAKPVVSAIAPNDGSEAGKTTVTITGSGFAAGDSVSFGSSAATSVTVKSETSIIATSPTGTGLVNVKVRGDKKTSATTPFDQFGYDPAPVSPWLGLNGNATYSYLDDPDEPFLGMSDFTKHDIDFDRSLEIVAGERVEGVQAEYLDEALKAGMHPMVVIDYAGYEGGEFRPSPDFPKTTAQISAYVKGFVKTAEDVRELHTGTQFLFEPMNEPWGYTEPTYNGAEYAKVIAKLLPEAATAGIPAGDIYVAAYGQDCGKTSCGGADCGEGCTSDGWVPAMYQAEPKLETEIEGWYFHPYGPAEGTAGGDSFGIESIPFVQEKMTSGQNNIIVSEVGVCSTAPETEGEGPRACFGNPQVNNSTVAAEELTETLEHARPYHEAGWLKALLVYSRGDSGWAMQLLGGDLTLEGKALDAFAQAHG
jgi:IPT/TIG domain